MWVFSWVQCEKYGSTYDLKIKKIKYIYFFKSKIQKGKVD